MTTTLFYFSGTGNSLKVARDLNEELEDSKLIPIAKAILEDNPTTDSEKVGFIFPLYYYGLPKIVYNFVESLNLDNANYIFAIITRAGDDDGVPFIQLEKLLRSKSKNLNAGYFIKMPDNFIIATNVIPEEERKILFEREEKEIKDISKSIKNNQNNLDIEIIEGKLNRIERGNLRFHTNVNKGDTAFFSDDSCNNCGICEKICPVNNIKLIDRKPIWQQKCEQCLSCINYCPVQSIQFGKNTSGRERYHHPEVKIKDIQLQKL